MIEALSPSANCRGGGGKRGMDDMNMDTNDSHIYSTSFSKSPEGSMQKKNRRPLVMSSPFEHENLIPQLGTHVNQSNIGFAHSEKRMRFKDDSFGGGEEENAMIQIQRHIQSMQQYHESQMITVRMQNQQEMAKKDSQIDGLTKLSKQLLEANERLDHNCKVLTDENKILKRGINLLDTRQKEVTQENHELRQRMQNQEHILAQAAQLISNLRSELRAKDTSTNSGAGDMNFGFPPPPPPSVY